ncbi:MAG: hypothetical protein R3E63_03475 [Pseudomonadales bacterium]
MTDGIPVLKPTTHADGLALLESCEALKKLPHVYEKVKKLWGFPAFFNYIGSLMMVEKGREGRQGFPEDVYRELMSLEKFFVEHPEAASHPSLVASDRAEILQLIQERAFNVNYTAGDRR